MCVVNFGLSEEDFRRLTLRKLSWLIRRYRESGREWDTRFALAVRWLINPHLKKGAQLALDQIYSSLKVDQVDSDQVDSDQAFSNTRAMLGAL